MVDALHRGSRAGVAGSNSSRSLLLWRASPRCPARAAAIQGWSADRRKATERFHATVQKHGATQTSRSGSRIASAPPGVPAVAGLPVGLGPTRRLRVRPGRRDRVHRGLTLEGIEVKHSLRLTLAFDGVLGILSAEPCPRGRSIPADCAGRRLNERCSCISYQDAPGRIPRLAASPADYAN